MIADDVLIGHEYIHVQTKHSYTVMELGKLKCPCNGGWYPAVFYKHSDNTPGVYARTIDSFKISFEAVENVIET